MKKDLAAAVFAVCIVSSIPAMASEGISVYINGNKTEFDTEPEIVNDRTVVPMRKIFEELGADVSWVEEHRLIMAIKESKIITMKIGSGVMLIQDIASGENKQIALDVQPFIKDGYTLVPLRAVAEGLLADVEWEEESSSVMITLE